MKVWIINPFDNLPLEGFRPQRYWLMASAFADAGHDVTLFTSDFNHTTKKRRSFLEKHSSSLEKCRSSLEGGAPRPTTEYGIRLELVPTRPYSRNVSFARIRSHRAFIKSLRSALQLQLHTSTPSLIIVSLPLIGTASVAFELKEKYGTKVVVDIQDDWPGTFYRLFPRIMRPFAKLAFAPLRRAAERAYRNADLVTGVADRYAELALSAGAKRYLRFYLGIKVENSATPHSTLHAPRSILYLGNLGRTYDLRTAIEAVALDPQLTLDIAGKGEQEESLKEFANKKGVADRVRFHGYLDEEKLSELASHCAFGLIPMSEDSCVGLPNKIADYARYGLFILSSLRGESAALLEKYHCGALYTHGDPRSLVEKSKSKVEVEQWNSTSSDFDALLSELDATRIYRAYVAEVEKL